MPCTHNSHTRSCWRSDRQRNIDSTTPTRRAAKQAARMFRWCADQLRPPCQAGGSGSLLFPGPGLAVLLGRATTGRWAQEWAARVSLGACGRTCALGVSPVGRSARAAKEGVSWLRQRPSMATVLPAPPGNSPSRGFLAATGCQPNWLCDAGPSQPSSRTGGHVEIRHRSVRQRPASNCDLLH